MATNRLREKSEVLDPLTMFHTVGQELEEAFKAQKKDVSLLGIGDISSKEKLSKSQIKKACTILGLDSSFAEFLESFQVDYAQNKVECKVKYKESKANYRRLKSVIPLLKNEFNDGFDILDDIVDFFGVNSEKEIFDCAESTRVLYRSQNQTEVDEINLSAWLQRGELDYRKMENLAEYDESKLMEWIEKREWREKITSLSYFRSLPKILKEFGVCLLLLPYIHKTVYGAVKWMDGHPVIMVSDRDQDLATCWFTLFHEFGHVIKHRDELIIDGMINGNVSKKKIARRECEANKFANEYLFNGDDLRKHIFELRRTDTFESQRDLSVHYNVEPIFVGYWMRKAQYYPQQRPNIPISFS
jgi:Zn-dependent peptidase ImmA (M78 family)